MNAKNVHNDKRLFFDEISFIRGVACLAVVMVHVTANYYYANGNTFNDVTLFFNQVTRLGTPIFAVIAGFLLFNQSINRNFEVGRFVKTRFAKIVIPFLIWSIVYLALKDSYGNSLWPDWSSTEEIKKFFYTFFTGGTHAHLYFIAMVIQFYVLFIGLSFIKSKTTVLLATLFSAFASYFFNRYQIDFGGVYVNEFLNSRSFILSWIFYFMLGGLLLVHWKSIVIYMKKGNLYVHLLALVLFSTTIDYHFQTSNSSNKLLNMINVPLFFISLSTLYHSISTSSKLKKTIVQIGNFSMGIYLVHPLFLYIMARHDLFEGLYRTRYLILVFIFVIALSFVTVWLISKLPFGKYIVTIATSNTNVTLNKNIPSTNKLIIKPKP